MTTADGVEDADEKNRRGSSFGAVAAAYAELRPDYPVAAVRWCVEPLARAAGEPRVSGEHSVSGQDSDLAGLRVLDLGAGTGKLTALLVQLGADVTAVDPDEAMLAELGRQLPSARALHGSAEAIPLPDGSVDAVLCGQSMHWFDLPRALPEIARVLVDGGVLAGLWNSDDDRVPWVAGLADAAERRAAPTLTWRREEAAHYGADQSSTGQFSRFYQPVERAEFPNSQLHTAESLIATVATHSRFLIMPEAERDRLLAQVRDYLASRPETAGEFELPMVVTALRAVRAVPADDQR